MGKWEGGKRKVGRGGEGKMGMKWLTWGGNVER